MIRTTFIIIFSLATFLPAIALLTAGLPLGLYMIVDDIMKGHIEAILMILPLLGGVAGLGSAFLVTFDVINDESMITKANYKRTGLVIGVISEAVVVTFFQPNFEPFAKFWLPPFIGAVVLFVLSFRYSRPKLRGVVSKTDGTLQ